MLTIKQVTHSLSPLPALFQRICHTFDFHAMAGFVASWADRWVPLACASQGNWRAFLSENSLSNLPSGGLSN